MPPLHPPSAKRSVRLNEKVERMQTLNGPRRHLPEIDEEDFVDRKASEHITRFINKLEDTL